MQSLFDFVMWFVFMQGLFDILTISGSFSLSEGGQQSRTGGLSISLACQDARFLGGCVAGPLIAASPVQVCKVGFELFHSIFDILILHTSDPVRHCLAHLVS